MKLIGATGHYVTEQLDGGPIIAQSTVPVGHRDEVDDLILSTHVDVVTEHATAEKFHAHTRGKVE